MAEIPIPSELNLLILQSQFFNKTMQDLLSFTGVSISCMQVCNVHQNNADILAICYEEHKDIPNYDLLCMPSQGLFCVHST